MNIDFMKYYYENKEASEHELMNFAEQVQIWKESGVLHDATFEKCKAYAASIQADINQMEASKALFLNCISSLSTFRFQKVITEKLVNNKTWADVASAMELSSQHIQNSIYPKAIKELGMLLAAVG